MESVLDKLYDHLIAKNVAADIAIQLWIHGQQIGREGDGDIQHGDFHSKTGSTRVPGTESAATTLYRHDPGYHGCPASSECPYVVTFCRVNGVGKSTNLANISFWLLENDFSVLIVTSDHLWHTHDTFHAGAMEHLQLWSSCTHTPDVWVPYIAPPSPPRITVVAPKFEKGYGKDVTIAFECNQGFDAVLVNTWSHATQHPSDDFPGQALTANTPNLVHFVGEALVGNEAVDQLLKFNKALADHSMLGSSMTQWHCPYQIWYHWWWWWQWCDGCDNGGSYYFYDLHYNGFVDTGQTYVTYVVSKPRLWWLPDCPIKA